MRRIALCAAFACTFAQADAVDALRDFARDAKSGRATAARESTAQGSAV